MFTNLILKGLTSHFPKGLRSDRLPNQIVGLACAQAFVKDRVVLSGGSKKFGGGKVGLELLGLARSLISEGDRNSR